MSRLTAEYEQILAGNERAMSLHKQALHTTPRNKYGDFIFNEWHNIKAELLSVIEEKDVPVCMVLLFRDYCKTPRGNGGAKW